MNSVSSLQAVVLGIVQGFTELLPISSSAHLYFIPWILKWNIPDSFDVALHFGTLISIGVFFFDDWLALLKGGYNRIINKQKSIESKILFFLIIATIPGAIIGFVLDNLVGDNLFKMPLVIAIVLIVMGVFLYFIDKNSKAKIEFKNIDLKQSFIIGLSQAIAFIPGISRSGITMTSARMMGIKRKAAAKFSFMLSTPIILAATIFKLKDFDYSIPFFVGVVTSTISGMLAIKYMLKYLEKSNFKVFAIYRILVGALIIAIYLYRLRNNSLLY